MIRNTILKNLDSTNRTKKHIEKVITLNLI